MANTTCIILGWQNYYDHTSESCRVSNISLYVLCCVHDTVYLDLPFLLLQYEGDDEDVDVEKVDSEMLDFDLNNEVEIE